jgi:hypothetical protein
MCAYANYVLLFYIVIGFQFKAEILFNRISITGGIVMRGNKKGPEERNNSELVSRITHLENELKELKN